MGSSNGGSDAEPEAKEVLVPPPLKPEATTTSEGEAKEPKVEEAGADLLLDLGLVESKVYGDELVAPAVPVPPPPPPPPPSVKSNYHKQTLAPFGNPRAKHCYDK